MCSAARLLDDRHDRTAPTATAPFTTVEPSTVHVEVLNGAGVRGLAAQTKQALTGLSFQVTGKGDADSSQYDHTVIRYSNGQENAARTLATFIESGRRAAAGDALRARGDVQLVLGRDFTSVQLAAFDVRACLGGRGRRRRRRPRRPSSA